jgi:hypothetical protein
MSADDDWNHISVPVNRILERTEAPRIAAIPTQYAGVNFRSRLEAKWAAFFDLNGWAWEYEPIDFDGWIPDFLLRLEMGRRPMLSGEIADGGTADIFAEVKPVALPSLADDAYRKAVKHSGDVCVLLLGAAPVDGRVGYLLEPPGDETWSYLYAIVNGYDPQASLREEVPVFADQGALWREAGNRVQWKGSKP